MPGSLDAHSNMKLYLSGNQFDSMSTSLRDDTKWMSGYVKEHGFIELWRQYRCQRSQNLPLFSNSKIENKIIYTFEWESFSIDESDEKPRKFTSGNVIMPRRTNEYKALWS